MPFLFKMTLFCPPCYLPTCFSLQKCLSITIFFLSSVYVYPDFDVTVGYSYLAFTIPRFLSPEEFSSVLRQTGFRHVSYKSLFLGVSAIHLAVK